MRSAVTVNDSIIYATIVALVLALCALLNRRRDPASPGPDSEELSGARQWENPTEAPVASGGTHLDAFADAFTTRLERSPERDRALDLLSDISPVSSGLSRRANVRSTAAGAPAVHIYRWVRPAESKRMQERGWWLEHVDPRYGTHLVRKEERWP